MSSVRSSKKSPSVPAPADTAAPASEPVDTGFLRTLVGYNTRRAALSIIAVFMERMAVYDLKVVDFSVLSLVAHNPGITSRQLCATLSVLPPNMVGLIAALERRGKEMLGAGLVLLGVLIAMMLLSYSPDDPSFMSATDQPAQNYLGSPGAYIASALFMITGYGTWALVLGAVVWGLRLMLHRGEERIMRGIFLPIAVVLVSVYATSLAPPADWTQSFGLGGHLGDMLMGGMLSAMPIRASIAIKFLALLTAAGAVAFLAFVLGFDSKELTAIRRFLLDGLATARLLALHALDRGARLSSGAARELKSRADARRERTARAGAASLPQPVLSRDAAMPTLGRAPAPLPEDRGIEPELVEAETHYADDDEAPSNAAISARITDAIRQQ